MILDGTTQIGTPALSADAASFSTSTLAVGSHSITVIYHGDADFTGNTSAGLDEVIKKPSKAKKANFSLKRFLA